MADEQPSTFDQAAEALQRAMKATHIGEQSALLDEALRLHRRALSEERAKLAELQPTPPSASDPSGKAPNAPA